MKSSKAIKRLAHAFPKLQTQLAQARMKGTDVQYLSRAVKMSVATGVAFTAFFFFVFTDSILKLLFVFFISIGLAFLFFLKVPSAYINRKKKEIDRNVLFAGQYLLVKIESGEPLYNTMVGVGESFGETGAAFKEVARYVKFGEPIEKAIDRGVANSPSLFLQKIFWEMSNSVRTGTDIKRSLRAILEEIHNSYILEIEKYGKKLNSVTLLYMVIGIIAPSLGMTMFVIISSFVKINVPFVALLAVLFFLAVLHFFFITIFNSIRPAVDL